MQWIKPLARATRRPGVVSGIGGFGALFEVPVRRYRHPILVSSADGVGTKLKCATRKSHYGILGVDLVGMNVNDILTTGAEPLFFLDYFAVGRFEAGFMREVMKGISRACRDAGAALVGGETAEMPGVYRRGDFDLAGFAVGVVEKDRLIDGSRVHAGDRLIGLGSNGLHANGFSFVRKAFSNGFLNKHIEEFFRPTRIYVRPVLQLLKRVDVLGMAHITGGGFYDNIPRALPRGLGVIIHTGSWKVPRVFEWIQERSNASFREMHRTFNMGIGYVLIVSPQEVTKALRTLSGLGVPAWVIGKTVKGRGVEIQ